MWHFCDCVGPSLKCCVPPPQEVKSMFECLFNYKHFIVDLLAQPIVAVVSFITIIVCKFVLQTSDLHRTRTGSLAWLMFADISVHVLCMVSVGMAGLSSGCHLGPSSNGYDWSLAVAGWWLPHLSHWASSHHREQYIQRAESRPHPDTVVSKLRSWHW